MEPMLDIVVSGFSDSPTNEYSFGILSLSGHFHYLLLEEFRVRARGSRARPILNVGFTSPQALLCSTADRCHMVVIITWIACQPSQQR
jgi:hypothetical protein